MNGVEIHDRSSTGVLAFDLRDILDALGPRARALAWRCSAVECTGDGADQLHRVADAGAIVDGATLDAMARKVSQVIDGRFVGRATEADAPEIVIRAVDGALWEVFGNAEVLAAIRRRFSDVRPTQYDAG